LTEESRDSIVELVWKITKQLDEFEVHLIGYQEKVRRALLESGWSHD